MHVAGLHAEPVHGGQRAHRVAGVGVGDQLRLRRGAGGEVQQQQVVGAGRAVGLEHVRRDVGVVEVVHRDHGHAAIAGDGLLVLVGGEQDDVVVGGDVGEAVQVTAGGDHHLDAGALQALRGLRGRQLDRRGADHGAELHGGQQRLPQLDLVVQHEHDAVAAADAQATQVVGHAVGAAAHEIEGVDGLRAVGLDDPQRRLGVLVGDDVEPVQRPVEVLQVGPLERLAGALVVGARRQEGVAGGAEGLAVAGVAGRAQAAVVLLQRLYALRVRLVRGAGVDGAVEAGGGGNGGVHVGSLCVGVAWITGIAWVTVFRESPLTRKVSAPEVLPGVNRHSRSGVKVAQVTRISLYDAPSGAGVRGARAPPAHGGTGPKDEAPAGDIPAGANRGRRWDSNPQPSAYKAGALPIAPLRHRTDSTPADRAPLIWADVRARIRM